jgi:uncharacterized protein YggE
MTRTLAIVLSSAALAAATPLAPSQRIDAQGIQTLQPAGEVRASGVATVGIEPDLAIITVQYSANGRTPAAAGKSAAARADAIRRAIVAVGIPYDSIPTKSRYSWWWGGNRSQMEFRNNMRDTIYVTNDAFSVRVRDFKLLGRVIDTALAEGAQTISNVSFQATNDSPARIRAIKEATAQARANAGAIAEASGLRMGRVLEISTDASPYMMAQDEMSQVGFAQAKAIATQVVAPELKVTVTVSGRWEMLSPR